MSPYGRRMVVGLAIALSITAAGAAAKSHEPAPKPPPRCTRTVVPGEFRCSFPTHSHLRAVVYVQTWEDGSARAVAIDPDRRSD